MSFTDRILNLIVGIPWGETSSGRAAPPPPANDGRTAALNVLADFISELTFYRRGDDNKPTIAFQLPRDRIFVEAPDAEQEYRELPAMALVASGEANYNSLGLGSSVDEDTYGKYAPATALTAQSDYREIVFIDILCKTKQERRAIREGLVHAMNPTEFMYGLRLRMPDYFNQVATYSLNTSSTIDDALEAAKNRRSLRVSFELSFVEVRLVPFERLVPQFRLDVDTDEFEEEEAHVDVVGEEAEDDLPTEPFVDRP